MYGYERKRPSLAGRFRFPSYSATRRIITCTFASAGVVELSMRRDRVMEEAPVTVKLPLTLPLSPGLNVLKRAAYSDRAVPPVTGVISRYPASASVPPAYR